MSVAVVGWLLAGVFSSLTVVLIGLIAASRRGRRRQRAEYAATRNQIRADVVSLLTADTPDPAALARAVARPRQMLIEVLASALATVTVPAGVPDAVADLLGLTGPLEADLTAPSAETRAAAADLVGDLRLEAMIPALYSTMRDADPVVRLAGARAYSRLAAERCAPALLRMLRSETGAQQDRVAELVAHLGPAAAPAIADHIAAEGRTPVLISLLSRLGDPHQALPVLADAVGSPDPAVRKAAADGLGRTAAALAIPALIEATSDPVPDVRAAAAAALGVLGFPETTGALVALLDDPQWAVRHRAAQALGSMPGGVETLAHVAAGAPKFVVTAASTVLQQQVISTGLLAGLVGEDPKRRADVERLLGVLVDDAGYQKLIADLARRYPDPLVRARIVEMFPGLTGIGGGESPPADAAAGPGRS